MPPVHRQEKEQLQKLFTQEHIDRFEDRFKVYETFLKTERHVTIDELAQLLDANGDHFDFDFVQDTLELMSHFGFARVNQFESGPIRYEHRHLGQHHDHMICTKCRQILEFENEALEEMQIKIAGKLGFHMLQHKMEIYGICADCQKQRAGIMPLLSAKQGERLVVSEFTGGRQSHMRLTSMGLRLGDRIEVVTNMPEGRVVVAADNKRYVLGRGLANKIIVQSQ
jgi:Fur family transcriptional regulator, ferric uptake regulator